jgi:hypothetical protein
VQAGLNRAFRSLWSAAVHLTAEWRPVVATSLGTRGRRTWGREAGGVMLTTIGMWLGAAVGLVLVFAAWMYYRAVAGGNRAMAELAARIEPVTQALTRGETPASADLLRFAQDRVTRKVLFGTLDAAKRTDLFPAQHLTWESMAEADLVAWLCHPNELGCPPDGLELVARVPAPDSGRGDSIYFLFRYRTVEPHWAAKDGWLAGVAGPYPIGAPPVPQGRGTFSRFEAIDSRTAESHVAVAHETVFGDVPPVARSA